MGKRLNKIPSAISQFDEDFFLNKKNTFFPSPLIEDIFRPQETPIQLNFYKIGTQIYTHLRKQERSFGAEEKK